MLYVYDVGGNTIALAENKHNIQLSSIRQAIFFDQLIVWSRSDSTVTLEIYNYDGSKAAQCGNGLSALAHHLDIKDISILIHPNIYRAVYLNCRYWVAMGEAEIIQLNESIYEVSIGNKHIISLNQPYDEELNKAWKQSHNISHIFTSDMHNILISTYERGCGRTGSCASASTAACALLKHLNQSYNSWLVHNPSGLIEVFYQQDNFFQSGFPALIKQVKTLM